MPYDHEDDDLNVYDDENREELIDDDEITAEEEGFMKGYNDDENYCMNCGSLIEPNQKVEKEIDGKMFNFCSEECAEMYEE
ncbi:MAG: hypothetical protein QW594_03085 [Candidatus Woesearchaeota archaeon]